MSSLAIQHHFNSNEQALNMSRYHHEMWNGRLHIEDGTILWERAGKVQDGNITPDVDIRQR